MALKYLQPNFENYTLSDTTFNIEKLLYNQINTKGLTNVKLYWALYTILNTKIACIL